MTAYFCDSSALVKRYAREQGTSWMIGLFRRPTLTDAYSQADPKKPIYPVRTILTTCTDYRTAITTRKMERLYDCFTHKSGGIQCTQVGRTAGLMEDEKQYVQKQ